MVLNVALSLIAVAIGLVYFWIRKIFSFFKDNGFEYVKPQFPFGNLKGVGKDFHVAELMQKHYMQFKGKVPAFGLYFFTNPVIVLTDIELIKNVLVRDFDNFHNRGIYYNTKDDPLSGHLFAIENQEWKNIRRKLTPTFTSGKMRMMFGTVIDIADVMVAQLNNAANFDAVEMKETLAKFTTDTIGNIAFGLELNSINDPNSMFRKMGRKIFRNDSVNLQLKILLLTSFRKLSRVLHMRITMKDVSDFFRKSIKDTVEYRLKNNIQRNDFMDLVLKMYDGNKAVTSEGGLTLDQLSAQCFFFFVAGK